MTPTPSRPFMPGYGIVGAAEGRGLLPWSWAEERLTSAACYWLASATPAGRPHVMPVWGAWYDGALWFSSSDGSRKARNLAVNPAAVATTDDPHQPVVVEGRVTSHAGADEVSRFVERTNAKYHTDYGLDFFVGSSVFRLGPDTVFGLDDADFTGTPTRWRFGF